MLWPLECKCQARVAEVGKLWGLALSRRVTTVTPAGRRKSTVMEYDCGRISTRYHLPAQLAEPQIHILRWLTRHHIFISSDLQFPTPPRGSEHICDN